MCILGIAVNDASLYLIYPVLTWFYVWHNHIFRCSTGWTTMGSLTLTQFTFNMIINKLMCKQITLMWRTMRLIQGTALLLTRSFSSALVLSLYLHSCAFCVAHQFIHSIHCVVALLLIEHTQNSKNYDSIDGVKYEIISISIFLLPQMFTFFLFVTKEMLSYSFAFCGWLSMKNWWFFLLLLPLLCFLFLTSAFRQKLTRTNQIIERILKTI